MPLDTAVQDLIDALGQQGMKPFEQLSVEEARGVVQSFTGLQKPAREVADLIETTYPGPAGEQPLRIYKPDVPAPLPVVVYFHGGGFIAGNLDVAEEPNRALANDVGAIVVAAGYRLAPEHQFPAATDDTYAALQWVAANIHRYGGDPSRMAVMGDSAGGNLATVAALRARDENGPDLRAQVLIYPVIDSQATLPSHQQFKEGYIIGAGDLQYFWDHYLPSAEHAQHPHATPSRAETLAGLPPALVLSTEYEVARDEAEAYAEQLTGAGVDCTAVRFDGLIHGVYWMSGAVPRSQELHDTVVSFLRDKLGVPDE